MKLETYHYELKDILNQFIHAFDGTIISRLNKDREVVDKIKVRYVYAPKQRVLHDLINKAQHITIPAVSLQISNISRDRSRVFNKNIGSYHYDQTENIKIPQPVPVDITVNVSILTRYQSDMDQIISNFVPYCDPYFVIIWNRYNRPEFEIRTHVIWNNALSMSYPTDINNNQPARVTCDTSFVIKGWLFKYDFDPEGLIFNINTDFTSVPELMTFDELELTKNDSNTDSFTTEGRPTISSVTPWKKNSQDNTTHTFYGDNFTDTLGVYLSSNDDEMFVQSPSSFDLFSDSPSLSANYPAFDGLEATFEIKSDNAIEVFIPFTIKTSGKIDVIIMNQAGYGKLTTDTISTNFDYQYPYSEGLDVFI